MKGGKNVDTVSPSSQYHLVLNLYYRDASFQAKAWIQPLAIYFQAICFSFLCTNWTILDSFQAHSCFLTGNPIQCVPEKRKPINRVNFSENCNELSEKDYIVTKFNLSSFFWHQLQNVLAMHEQARTISNVDVKNDLRRMGI